MLGTNPTGIQSSGIEETQEDATIPVFVDTDENLPSCAYTYVQESQVTIGCQKAIA